MKRTSNFMQNYFFCQEIIENSSIRAVSSAKTYLCLVSFFPMHLKKKFGFHFEGNSINFPNQDININVFFNVNM